MTEPVTEPESEMETDMSVNDPDVAAEAGADDALDDEWVSTTGRRSDWRLVLKERRGTCSTKHALLTELARENDRLVLLVLGIYEMDEINTPGVGSVLQRYGLRCVPEAHCHLVYEGTRLDLTRDVRGERPIEDFLYEEEIAPQQIGGYKVDKHRAFVRQWAAERGLGFEQIWRVREVCIVALTERSNGGDA